MADDHINFENIIDVLSTGIAPEISHFKKQVHPGRNWWLKTVIPIDDTTDPSRVWYMIHKKEPLNVHITDFAYDWYGNAISAYSVWIREGIDVIIKIGKNGKVDYKISPFSQSFNESGKWLYDELTKSWESNTQNINDEDWHKLFSVAELMSGWTTESQASEKRKVFKIISDEKDNSQTNQPSKLDSK